MWGKRLGQSCCRPTPHIVPNSWCGGHAATVSNKVMNEPENADPGTRLGLLGSLTGEWELLGMLRWWCW